MLGQVIPGDFGGLTGQCYAVSAYYAHSINSKIILRGGVAASDIGSDYDWKGWGWTVVNEPKYSQIKVGDIINFKRGANMGTWNTDSEDGHTAVVGKILGQNKLMIYDQNPTPLKTWTYTYNSGVASVIHPPK
ncbi:CHAP domain-containing protein [Lactococcus lactis]